MNLTRKQTCEHSDKMTGKGHQKYIDEESKHITREHAPISKVAYV